MIGLSIQQQVGDKDTDKSANHNVYRLVFFSKLPLELNFENF